MLAPLCTYIHNAAYDTLTVSWSLRCTDSRMVSSGTVEAAEACPERFQVIRDHPGTEARRHLAPVREQKMTAHDLPPGGRFMASWGDLMVVKCPGCSRSSVPCRPPAKGRRLHDWMRPKRWTADRMWARRTGQTLKFDGVKSSSMLTD